MRQCEATKDDSAADKGFGPELVRLRPRSGYEYAFSGDAPRWVHYALFLAWVASAVLGVFLADVLELITQDSWYDWWENLRAFAVLVACALCGFAASVGVAGWAFRIWLSQHELVVFENGLCGRFPDLDFAAPFDAVSEIWLCQQIGCPDDERCIARTSAPATSSTASRWLESILSWYFGALAIVVGVAVTLIGGGVPMLPKRQPTAKLFLTLRGGVAYALGRYLRRFRAEDRDRVIEMLRSRLPGVFKSHQAGGHGSDSKRISTSITAQYSS
jgi:hypothetical protein